MADFAHYRRVADQFPMDSSRIVALFHDYIEDGLMIEGEVLDVFLPEVAEAIICLTRRRWETYADYIERVNAGPELARRVKVADLRDNLARMDAEHESLRPRYERALAQLTGRAASEDVSG